MTRVNQSVEIRPRRLRRASPQRAPYLCALSPAAIYATFEIASWRRGAHPQVQQGQPLVQFRGWREGVRANWRRGGFWSVLSWSACFFPYAGFLRRRQSDLVMPEQSFCRGLWLYGDNNVKNKCDAHEVTRCRISARQLPGAMQRSKPHPQWRRQDAPHGRSDYRSAPSGQLKPQ